ncbi:hypothetical protein P0W64_17840 [Tsukamurella sp. 8F]|uniref:hypothetical protein n=1 Tax=unclassified Tsukamurella TaxID=2633480 RepID=UPI0023B8C26E|nr:MULTISPECIES: hypothetical protein [unclassified Tsukamurella]MDF0529897.1 hypothetical protein [Tsukamurella sp. 8J]MDF0588648.1 hypothetical protein [Tsukamurella sp. 8F]
MGDLPALRRGSPRVRVSGRDGVGRATLARALAASGVDIAGAEGPADVDLYAFSGAPRAADRAAAAPGRVVVWTKADAAGSWQAADARAAEYAALLGTPVVPVIALLATIELGAREYAALAAVAAAPRALPAPVSDMRAVLAPLGTDHLLDRLGGYGLACAVGALRERPDLTAAALSRRLRGLSGLDGLREPVRLAVRGMGVRRAAERLDALRELAVADPACRDACERELLDAAAVR